MRHTIMAEPPCIDPFQSRYIPPQNLLLSWRSMLSNAEKLSSCSFFIETDNGNLNLKTVNIIKLHKLKEIKLEVVKEMDWFNESFATPKSIASNPSIAAINNFRSVILNNPADQISKVYHMTTTELSRLCDKRLLSCDQMLWFSNQLNRQQNETWCIYLNFTNNISQLEKRYGFKPTSMCFIVNVGMYNNDATYICGSENQGCHWSTIFVDSIKKTAYYGDSLSWPIPNDLEERMEVLCQSIWGNFRLPEIIYTHNIERKKHAMEIAAIILFKRVTTCVAS